MYDDIISVENLCLAWSEFVRGKASKNDVTAFSLDLGSHVIALHEELAYHTYRHGGYQTFRISDPKPRVISKACVRDRLLHHAIYRILYPLFDRTFIFDSYSCRIGKGTHKAINRFAFFARKTSRNNTRTCWALQCDIRRFFDSIDHDVLLNVMQKRIADPDVLRLLEKIIASFHLVEGKGVPLGNLTSQLLVNVYMNEFDQCMKHILKVRYYIRYADDFVVLSDNRQELERMLLAIRIFLYDRLRLELHPNKVRVKTLASGIDFLGWVHFPTHRVIRTATRRKMVKRL
jgi:retron-type reverse transcriptase